MPLSGTVHPTASPQARRGQRAPGRPAPARATPRWLGAAAAGCDSLTILTIALVVALGSHGDHGLRAVHRVLPTSLVVTALVVGVGLLRHDYGLPGLAAARGQAERAISAWSIGFGIAAIGGAATGIGALNLRGATGLFFAAGLVTLALVRMAMGRAVRRQVAAGRIVARTTMVVVGEQDFAAVKGRRGLAACGGRVVGIAALRDDAATRGEDLALCVAVARMLVPDDIVLVLPWDDQALLDQTVAALRQLPAAIHLGPPARLCGEDRLAGIELIAPPLSPLDRRVKRAFDVLAAGTALVLLSPLLLLIAAAIRLDSRGPVLFRQRRYGFNQQPFRILKFRSMTTLEDSAALRQVTAGDSRVTRVGRILRRTSLDELPQLVNVLKGDMSLIGPRPHALAHDQQFERMVALYGRRHTVRPGITGLAQVSGFRGETDTADKIEGRVRHDLAYVDNWSLWFDLTILFRTVFSREAFRNAK